MEGDFGGERGHRSKGDWPVGTDTRPKPTSVGEPDPPMLGLLEVRDKTGLKSIAGWGRDNGAKLNSTPSWITMLGLVGSELPARLRLNENNRGREDFDDFEDAVEPYPRSGDVGSEPGSSNGPRAASSRAASSSAAFNWSLNFFSAFNARLCSSVCASAMNTLAATFPRSNIEPFLVLVTGVGGVESEELDAIDFADVEEDRTLALLVGSGSPGVRRKESFMHFLAFLYVSISR